ncbi:MULTISPECIES: DEAD/DEAH box helicase [Brachybacterium]|uniref:DEAD/DEAH box helicase n=1 Tax=Brachybacterium kimchii TaxID=2942909 RepID=A0ABY4NAR7_9MICO|nr:MULTISPECIES: DEAD/DEAH box helicase [Brachybacterium]MCG7308291.1 DEAD/DEAH box helicase [Brachybacterium sp. ACRRE]UQN30470.1 DEAD/DEAH box helicase [Brachybacterium kimchii]
MPYALLTGTRENPRLDFHVARGSVHRRTGEDLVAALRAIPGITVDTATGRCVADSPTAPMLGLLADAGVLVDAFDFPETLASLHDPLVLDRGHDRIEVYPRLALRDDVAFNLGEGADFDPATGSFTATASAVSDWPRALLPDTLNRAQPPKNARPGQDVGGTEFAIARIENPSTPEEAARNAAAAPSVQGYEQEFALLTRAVGDAPDWFGMDPYPYQHIGALCVAAGGRHLLADEPGLGKSVQGILAAVLLGAQRWIVACPPVAQSNWAAEIERCRVPEHIDGAIAVIRPGRKVPELPERGMVVVTDSLLAAPTRSELLEDLMEWNADVLIYDEGHRARNWDSQRSKAMRRLAHSATERFVLTGTPLMTNPADLPSLLEITGQLKPIFGSRTAFMNRYTRSYDIQVGSQTITKVVPAKQHLGELGDILREQVWVRRTKEQVLPDLPEKQHSTMIVDVPPTEYRKATREVQEKIAQYLRDRSRELGGAPSEGEVRAWCADQMGCVSLLRRAAGLSKTPAAAEHISEWVESTSRQENGETVYDRPLIVWGIHQVVMDSLDEHLEKLGVPHAVINGKTSMVQRDRIKDAYQDGKIAVILANIVAAGVAITLTRGSDALFVETEWIPDLVSQAEDRQHRIGQERTVMVTTMVAPGTLDHTIQRVLRKNIEVLDQVVGGTGHRVAVAEQDMDSLAIGDVMWEIAEPLLRKCERAFARRGELAAA